MDWLSTTDTEPILGVSFATDVKIFCPRRLSYLEDSRVTGSSRWEIVAQIDLIGYVALPILSSLGH